MKLTIFNGSPRGARSNTDLLLRHFVDGFTSTPGNAYAEVYLNRVKDADKFVKLFEESEHVLLAFPLYSDSMPSIVKMFIDSLEPLCGRPNNPDIGFLVQGGLPERAHRKYTEVYLEKLARRLGCKYIGTITKGTMEGVRSTPEMLNRNLFKSFYELGKTCGQTGTFDSKIVEKVSKPDHISKSGMWFLNLLANMLYWRPLMKEHNALEKRYDRPF